MKRYPISAFVLLALTASCQMVDSAPITRSATTAPLVVPTRTFCPPGVARFRCYARVVTDEMGRTVVSPHAGGGGLGASDLAAAYQLDTSRDPNATIAIVDAYGYSAAESDLAQYRSMYGLPACTTANGCLKIVNQTGGSSLPRNNTSWGLEESLDVDMVSAICENCH